MNAFTVLLALLCSSDVSFSFLTSPHPNQVNAVPFFGVKKTNPPSRLFYYGDYEDNYFHLASGNLRGGANADSNKGSLYALSVSELKRLLNDRGVD